MKSRHFTEKGRGIYTSVDGRAAAEEEYAKKLLKISKMPLGTKEVGTLRASLVAVKTELEGMGNAHAEVAVGMHRELEEALGIMAGRMKELKKMAVFLPSVLM
jgi:Fes/CIP4, and EFC/F-BAR homology domain